MEYVLPMIPFNDIVKAQRKLLHQTLGSKGSVSHLHPIIEDYVHRMLYKIMLDPEQFAKHVKTCV